jgi:hypothetical protein
MKFFLTSFGEGNVVDGWIVDFINHIPKYSNHIIVPNIDDADVILFGHTHRDDYIFKPCDVQNKPIVIIDYIENSADYYSPHLTGFYCSNAMLNLPEYLKLHIWLEHKRSNIKMYFKREFFKDFQNIYIPLYPIDYVAKEPFFFNTERSSTYEEFCNRKCLIAWIWGLSNKSRPILHGEMMKHYGGEQLCLDEISFAKSTQSNKIVLFLKPYFIRLHFNDMMDIYSQSKIAITMWGCGRKCFKDNETCFDSVMAMQDTTYEYAYPWIDSKNCIMLPNKIMDDGAYRIDEYKAIDIMNYYLNRPIELYDIYLSGKENWKHYRIDKYLTNYIIPKLETIHGI